jgi:hypothetical protein
MRRLPAGSIRGAWLVLTTIWSHFPELEPKSEPLGPGYNVDLTKGQLEAFWSLNCWASTSLLLGSLN